ncbi:PhzF family phenazine biosynthesis protein [Pandoraea apista]|uniref:PhzF family phenazine biosynthesis protein n=1 Tax=Pandoraea apista TaxID=93218 RepID=A0ABX9ZHG1_9BURK|nr:PhzF family phenazine biosynthesis isomerase [Pandoraea apista]PTD98335.1 phenazine biosynthesis protein [Pandoraea apista]RRJ25703.1 PhzF family phenazine biosynthesis protein [Pandoraea apista]RRJ72798.1 PhzF family phenazine biosynthesis protein [Pandoraea apista]RSC97495.1 PhzF family phenazine biosynthesis protein [Pandoraea apista]RSD08310.1 PhzF family phenazine biosynthesis protein [Pandoraea apista]
MTSPVPFPLPAPATVSLVSVFPADDNGGNPAPIVLDADAMTADDMRAVATHYGHESAFVMAAAHAGNAWRFRFFVPNHEMEMCGHATLGALWVLRRAGRWDGSPVTIETLSGQVEGRLAADGEHIEVSQPSGRTAPIIDASAIAAICAALRISPEEIALEGICNAATSRVKTLVPLRSVERLQALTPDFTMMLATCDAIGSTGLYPCAREDVGDGRALPVLQARQFPRSSGYPEDAATGIAAAALLYGARRYGWLSPGERGVVVRQGVAMGHASAITVTLRDPLDAAAGCWISGDVRAM